MGRSMKLVREETERERERETGRGRDRKTYSSAATSGPLDGGGAVKDGDGKSLVMYHVPLISHP
jgi:hypothetical protein